MGYRAQKTNDYQDIFVPAVAPMRLYRRNALHKEKSLRSYRCSRSFSPSLLRRYDRHLLFNLSGMNYCASHCVVHEHLRKCPDKLKRTHELSQLLRKPSGTCSRICSLRGHFVNADRWAKLCGSTN